MKPRRHRFRLVIEGVIAETDGEHRGPMETKKGEMLSAMINQADELWHESHGGIDFKRITVTMHDKTIYEEKHAKYR